MDDKSGKLINCDNESGGWIKIVSGKLRNYYNESAGRVEISIQL